jgi:hypothetical protein
MERALIQAQTIELLDACLVKLFKGEYDLVIMMLTKKDIFGNWTEHYMGQITLKGATSITNLQHDSMSFSPKTVFSYE